MKPSITIWPESVPGQRRVLAGGEQRDANSVLATPTPSTGESSR
jgi:hypothetical protein